jgi:PST family polysaccharide transporter/lipopolysaccharide exporter
VALRLFEVISTVLLARLLVPKIFGVVSIVLFIRNGIDIFTKTSFKAALIYRKNDVEAAADTAWVLNVLRGGLLAAATFLAAPLIAGFYREPALGPAIRLISVVFVLDGFSNVNMVLFDRALDFKKIAVARLIGGFVYAVLVTSLAFALRSLWALLIGIVFNSAYDFVVSYLIQKKKPRLGFDQGIARDLFHYGKYVTGTGILVYLTTRGDDAVVGKLLDMEQLGFYAYAYAIANFPATHLTRVLSEVVFPSYSAVSDDLPKLGQAYLAVHKLVAYVALPVGVLLAVFSREVVLLALGPTWAPSVVPLRILLVFGVARSFTATTGPVFKAVGRPSVMFWIVLAKLVLILAVLIPLTRFWGLAGAALAVTVPMVLEQFYLWAILKRMIAVPPARVFGQLRIPATSSVLMGAAIILWKSVFPIGGLIPLILVLISALLFHGGISWAFDKDFFRGIVRS